MFVRMMGKGGWTSSSRPVALRFDFIILSNIILLFRSHFHPVRTAHLVMDSKVTVCWLKFTLDGLEPRVTKETFGHDKMMFVRMMGKEGWTTSSRPVALRFDFIILSNIIL